jgi:hypothetical protein
MTWMIKEAIFWSHELLKIYVICLIVESQFLGFVLEEIEENL